jgi:hypothetical protein
MIQIATQITPRNAAVPPKTNHCIGSGAFWTLAMNPGIICGSAAGAGRTAAGSGGARTAVTVVAGAESSGFATCAVPLEGGRNDAGDIGVAEAESATIAAAAHSFLFSPSSS